MPQIINTNISSLNAQRNLNRSQGDLSVALQRISSGLRINSAKDDAAGLAISDRLTTQIRGLNQAARNAADAISLAQTGEGALQEITNALQRMRELAVQSRNATNTDADRSSLDGEYQQLLEEIDNIAQRTAFNGRHIIDGSFGNAEFQVGANVGEVIDVDVSTSMRSFAIGSYSHEVVGLANSTVLNNATEAGAFGAVDRLESTNDSFSVNSTDVMADIAAVATGEAVTNVTAGNDSYSAAAIADGVNRRTDDTGVYATANASTVTVQAATVEAFAFADDVANADTLTYTLTLNNIAVVTQTEGDTPYTVSQLASAINNKSGQTGVVATVSSVGDLVMTAADGRNIVVGEALGADTDDTDAITGYFGGALTGAAGNEFEGQIYRGTVTFRSDQNIILNVDDETGDADLLTGLSDEANYTIAAGTIDATNLLTVSDSDKAILRIDQAINDADVLRGTFGAVQSRFESTIANLQTAAENQSAARSRIQDADFAAETAAMTRAQILQQAGTSILAQANSLPQNVLSLLQ